MYLPCRYLFLICCLIFYLTNGGCFFLITHVCMLHAKSLQSYPTLCDPMDCSLQIPLSMGFSRQEYWSGLAFPSPGDFPDPGIKPTSLMSFCLGRQVLFHLCHLGSPFITQMTLNFMLSEWSIVSFGCCILPAFLRMRTYALVFSSSAFVIMLFAFNLSEFILGYGVRQSGTVFPH